MAFYYYRRIEDDRAALPRFMSSAAPARARASALCKRRLAEISTSVSRLEWATIFRAAQMNSTTPQKMPESTADRVSAVGPAPTAVARAKKVVSLRRAHFSSAAIAPCATCHRPFCSPVSGPSALPRASLLRAHISRSRMLHRRANPGSGRGLSRVVIRAGARRAVRRIASEVAATRGD